MAEVESIVIEIHYDDGNIERTKIVPTLDGNNIREYDVNTPVALDDRDPGNTDPEHFTQPLNPDDDVLTQIYQK